MYILLVEDRPEDAELVITSLARSGISNEIRLATDGAKALAMARKETPLIMLLDMSIPVLDGMEVLKQMRRNGRLRRLPVIILSGVIAKGDDIKAYELGAKEIMLKPVDPDQLIDTLLRLGFKIRLEHPFMDSA